MRKLRFRQFSACSCFFWFTLGVFCFLVIQLFLTIKILRGLFVETTCVSGWRRILDRIVSAFDNLSYSKRNSCLEVFRSLRWYHKFCLKTCIRTCWCFWIFSGNLSTTSTQYLRLRLFIFLALPWTDNIWFTCILRVWPDRVWALCGGELLWDYPVLGSNSRRNSASLAWTFISLSH